MADKYLSSPGINSVSISGAYFVQDAGTDAFVTPPPSPPLIHARIQAHLPTPGLQHVARGTYIFADMACA